MTQTQRRILTVTQLSQEIKELLESAYPFVWVTGEISNFRVPLSGHFYFSLKDSAAQISAVMFRGQNRSLKFKPEDGIAVVAMGRLNVYETKGIYQIIVEYLEPEGIGILQLAFEQLKAKLGAEGLFDESRKKALPFLPEKVALVTSPTGAVIRDIFNVLDRRFPGVAVEVAPVRVQGEGAAQEIADALDLINKNGEADVIVVARGGGSLEDLQAFNSEIVARAIFASHIPVVSAVGHQTDFTIADFTADIRAATPSAAAEMIVPSRNELVRSIQQLRRGLESALSQKIRLLREKVTQLRARLSDPCRKIADKRLWLDDALGRIVRAISRRLDEIRERLTMTEQRMRLRSPRFMVQGLDVAVKHQHTLLCSAMQSFVESRKGRLHTAAAKVTALNPLAILKRGYSMTRALPDAVLVKDVDQVRLGQQLEVTVSKGAMLCVVERKIKHGQTNI